MTTAQNTAFAEALSSWIRREGLSIPRASARLGLTVGTITGWLLGHREPSAEEVTRVLERIARK